MRILLHYKKLGLIRIGVILFLVNFQCGRGGPESPIVAKVEDRLISADEFAYAYELAPRELTRLDKLDARLAVLDRLTDRILLSREAEKLGLDRADSVLQRSLDIYKRQAVNRELYRKHIRTPISVSEDEEREAFRRSKISYFIRHFETESTEDAKAVSDGIRPFEHKPLYPGVETIQMEPFGYMDVIPWRDIPANIEELIVNLPMYQISEPLIYNGKYHVFQVVEQEREILLRENDFLANRESIRGVLRKRKESVAAAAFVQNVMAPQGLIIKADALNQLTDHLWKNRPASADPQIQYISKAEIKLISQNESELGQQKIAIFKSGEMTVADILFRYKVNPQKISYNSKLALRESLKNAVALYVRDWVFSEKGIAEKLDRSPAVKEELRTRREFLLAQKMINRLYQEQANEAMSDEEFQKVLIAYTRNLKENATIQVFEERLMAVNTSDEGLSRKIDFIAVQTQ